MEARDMATIELTIDEETLHRAQHLARDHHLSLEQLIAEALRQYTTKHDMGHGLIGLFADEPQLLDTIVGSAMTARERDSLRTDG